MKMFEPGPKLTLMKGAIWSLGTRWGIRLVGFFNTLVMARLILPEDYGIVAMAFLAVGLIQSLLDVNAAAALVRKDKVTRSEVDSAWTLKGIQGLIMASVMLVSVPLVDMYFQDARVATILYVFAACVGLSGFSNIGLTLAQKNFEFALEFRFLLYTKLISVTLTVLAGWWLRDYRALVIGISAGYLGGFVLSYIVHPYRPRWDVREIKSIWNVTRWLMLANMGGFALRKGDEVVAARIGSANDFGLYSVGADIGMMPAGEVGPAVLRAFLPVLASMSNTEKEINSAVLKTLRVIATVTLPMSLGVAAISEPITRLILGDVWLGSAPYVAMFAIVGAMYALSGPINSLLTLRGRTHGLSNVVWLEFIIFAISAIILVPNLFLFGLVIARLVAAAVNLIVTCWLGSTMCGLRLTSIFAAIIRPLLGAIIMYCFLRFLIEVGALGPFELILGIPLGVVVFTAWCAITWIFCGRPDGMESTFLEVVQRLRLRGLKI